MTSPFPKVQPEQLAQAWARIEAQAKSQGQASIAALIANEPRRITDLRFDAAGLTLDASRQRLPLAMLGTLHHLAAAARVTDWRDAMIAGQCVNTSEDRPALHTALRDPDCMLHRSIDSSITETVRDTLERMSQITRDVQTGRWRGATGRLISDIVHVGIGGSQLGPELACDALAALTHPRLHCRFLGNMDPHAQHRALAGLNPLTTLVVIASKSWRTAETARNARAVRHWLIEGGVDSSDLGKHLIAVSSNLDAATELGVQPSHILPCPDWVGGRFSLWGAVGLPIMLMLGPEHFHALLRGAHALDRHFCEAPAHRNAPLMMALLSVWNATLIGSGTEVVIPYSDALRRVAAHLQQLQMESCGKSVTREGHQLTRPAMPVVWGEPGTESQHSFFQALHQGVVAHPVDFIIVGDGSDTDPWERGVALRANALAQAQALALGHQDADPQRTHPGNRPSTLIHLPHLDPEHFGALVALYEHKTACLGWLWNINPFDQWGVEYGKQRAAALEPQLSGSQPLAADLDAATAESLARMRPA